MVNLSKILRKDRALFLAYDHGFEHGIADFKEVEKAVDPQYILDVAHKGGFTAVILHKGLAEKYYDVWGADERGGIPLIIKLNGKTNIPQIEPYSPLVCSVEEAIGLGAAAVGYTIYLGSEKESVMLWEFGQIVRDAHRVGIPAIGWIYPRGKWVQEKFGSETDPEVTAYAARVGLELGADIVKIKYCGNQECFAKAVEAAGRCKVVLSGGEKTKDPQEFLSTLKEVMAAGAIGVAVGRNVWKSPKPLEITDKIEKIIFA